MSAAVAIGVGCRRGVQAAPVVSLVRDALACGGLTLAGATLFTVDDKQDEVGLAQAAAELATPLRFLSRAMLAGVATPTQSTRVQALFGVGSVAESAALAGAGCGATLVVPRMAQDGVTCAIARGAS